AVTLAVLGITRRRFTPYLLRVLNLQREAEPVHQRHHVAGVGAALLEDTRYVEAIQRGYDNVQVPPGQPLEHLGQPIPGQARAETGPFVESAGVCPPEMPRVRLEEHGRIKAGLLLEQPADVRVHRDVAVGSGEAVRGIEAQLGEV